MRVSIHRALVAVVISVAALTSVVATENSAQAGLPENCIERLEQKSEQLIASVDAAIAKKASLENHHMHLSGAWQEFATYFKSAWVAECLKTWPAHKDRYNKWLAARANPASTAAGAKLTEICTAFTQEKIHGHKTAIADMLDNARNGEVEGELRRVENLPKNKIVGSCKATADEVKALIEVWAPQMKQRAHRSTFERDLAGTYFNIARTLDEAGAALATKGKSILEAPTLLEGNSSGAADFGRAVERCVELVGKLKAAGAKADDTVANPQHTPPPRLPPGRTWTPPPGAASSTVGEMEARCGATLSGIAALFEKVRAHNDTYRAARSAAWEKQNLKGGDMKKVYGENGKRWPAIENLGATIVWTYRSHTTGAILNECKAYTFSKSGALKNRKVYACN